MPHTKFACIPLTNIRSTKQLLTSETGLFWQSSEVKGGERNIIGDRNFFPSTGEVKQNFHLSEMNTRPGTPIETIEPLTECEKLFAKHAKQKLHLPLINSLPDTPAVKQKLY